MAWGARVPLIVALIVARVAAVGGEAWASFPEIPEERPRSLHDARGRHDAGLLHLLLALAVMAGLGLNLLNVILAVACVSP